MTPLKAKMLHSLLILGLIAFPFTHADSASEFSPEQKAQVENIMHSYLIKNPQVVVEALQTMQQQQKLAQQGQSKTAIAANAQALFHDSISTISGNPKGNATIVSFFDYQCGYCKRMEPMLETLVKADSQLKFIAKQLPIFGGSSELAAKAVLAAQKQHKAQQLHRALMLVKQRLSEKLIFEQATAVGLNIDLLKTEMQNPAYAVEFKTNLELADKLGIQGTPAFVVAGNTNEKTFKSAFISGAVKQAELEKALAQVRN